MVSVLSSSEIFNHFIFATTLWGNYCRHPHFKEAKRRHREVQQLAPGPPAGKRKIWDLNPGRLALESMLLIINDTDSFKTFILGAHTIEGTGPLIHKTLLTHMLDKWPWGWKYQGLGPSLWFWSWWTMWSESWGSDDLAQDTGKGFGSRSEAPSLPLGVPEWNPQGLWGSGSGTHLVKLQRFTVSSADTGESPGGPWGRSY